MNLRSSSTPDIANGSLSFQKEFLGLKSGNVRGCRMRAESGLAALGEWNAEADIGVDPVERQLSTAKRKFSCTCNGRKVPIPFSNRGDAVILSDH